VRILVIDDAADIRLFVKAVLEGAGHEVMTAEDPMKAISLMSIADVDALVLDLKMPRFTGFELLEILRRDARTRLLPVLLLSSLDATEERARGLRLGALDFLPKPVDPEQLVVHVERMVTHFDPSAGGLAGELEQIGLVPVVQSLQQKGKSGILRLSGPRPGLIELREGALIDARIGLLDGAEAVLSMLALDAGRFRFEPHAEKDVPAAGGSLLPFSQLAIKATQLEEELDRVRDHLPAGDAGLFVAGHPSTVANAPRGLPLAVVYERVESLPGVTLAELLDHEFLSPVKLCLTVATLVRAAVIEAVMGKID
jgi:CheY-like chemotaxis protein